MVSALSLLALGSSLALSASASTVYTADDSSAYLGGSYGVAPNQTYISRPDLNREQ